MNYDRYQVSDEVLKYLQKSNVLFTQLQLFALLQQLKKLIKFW